MSLPAYMHRHGWDTSLLLLLEVFVGTRHLVLLLLLLAPLLRLLSPGISVRLV
jgi:hypothetical protein